MNDFPASKKYTLLLSLYLAQAIPMSFFSTVVPVIMRMENYSLASIGLLQLVKVPWILKFVWAPWIDKSSSTNYQYKRWIIGAEIFYAIVIVAIGFFDLSSDFSTIVVLMVGAFVLSATQDISSDALAVRILAVSQRSYGNSMQSAGSFLGTLIGSGVLLYLYTLVGWQNLLLVLAGFVVLALAPLKWVSKTPVLERNKKRQPLLQSIPGFFRQKGTARRIVLLSLVYSGLIGMLAMMKPFMVDAGFSVSRIAFIAGIFGTAFGAGGAFLGGFFASEMGKRNSIRRFALYGSLSAFAMIGLTFYEQSISWMIFPAVAMVWSAYSMASTAVYTISMEMVRKGHEGTDYTLQIVISHLSGIVVAIGSGKLADIIGYRGLFSLEAILGILFFILSKRLYQDHTKTTEENILHEEKQNIHPASPNPEPKVEETTV